MKVSLKVGIIPIYGAELNLGNLIWFLPIKDRVTTLIYKGILRGIRTKKKTGCFKHNLALNIKCKTDPKRTAVVRINKKIHITGLNNTESMMEVAEYLITILKETKLAYVKATELLPPSPTKEDLIKNERINSFVAEFMSDMKYETAIYILQVVLKQKQELFTGDPSLGTLNQVMENYSFRLPSPINVHKFPKEIESTGLFVCNSSQLSKGKIMVKYTYSKPGEKEKKVTFTISANGSITLSGPNFEIMEPVYNSFIKTYLQIEKSISVDYFINIKIEKRKGKILIWSKEDIAKIKEISSNFMESVKSGTCRLIS